MNFIYWLVRLGCLTLDIFALKLSHNKQANVRFYLNTVSTCVRWMRDQCGSGVCESGGGAAARRMWSALLYWTAARCSPASVSALPTPPSPRRSVPLPARISWRRRSGIASKYNIFSSARRRAARTDARNSNKAANQIFATYARAFYFYSLGTNRMSEYLVSNVTVGWFNYVNSFRRRGRKTRKGCSPLLETTPLFADGNRLRY